MTNLSQTNPSLYQRYEEARKQFLAVKLEVVTELISSDGCYFFDETERLQQVEYSDMESYIRIVKRLPPKVGADLLQILNNMGPRKPVRKIEPKPDPIFKSVSIRDPLPPREEPEEVVFDADDFEVHPAPGLSAFDKPDMDLDSLADNLDSLFDD